MPVELIKSKSIENLKDFEEYEINNYKPPFSPTLVARVGINSTLSLNYKNLKITKGNLTISF